MAGAGLAAALASASVLTSGCGAGRSPLPVLRVDRLPHPGNAPAVYLDAALTARRSHRAFTDRSLTDLEVSRLLWAAQGVTAAWGGRTAPSAGALYPLELYLLTAGSYRHYLPDGHRLELLAERDLRAAVSAAALHQPAVGEAALTIVITAVFARTTRRYGDRGRRYVDMEAGHAAQNALLEAVALGLAAVPIGAFDDRLLAQALRLPSDRAPLYLVAIGHARAAGGDTR